MLGIDTKILVRLLVADDADQTRRARRIGVRGPVKRDLLRLHGRGSLVRSRHRPPVQGDYRFESTRPAKIEERRAVNSQSYAPWTPIS